jgi:hypothetical protein
MRVNNTVESHLVQGGGGGSARRGGPGEKLFQFSRSDDGDFEFIIVRNVKRRRGYYVPMKRFLATGAAHSITHGSSKEPSDRQSDVAPLAEIVNLMDALKASLKEGKRDPAAKAG